MQIQSVAKREDIKRCNVFISWTGADENIKSEIARCMKDKNLTVCESDAECAGNFLQWSVEAAVKSGVFLLILTENLVENEKSVARQEIKAWKDYFKEGEDYANRTIVVCSDLALLGAFRDENGAPYISAADCLSCETFAIEKGLDERNLQNIYNKTVKLIVGRMSRIYADKSASGRSIDITRLLGVDLLDTEETKIDFDKIYIPRSLKFDDKIYYRVKALADDTNNNVLFITAKAGSGKSCFIGQIINEYKNIDGALVLTATCPDAAKYCIANESKNEKYPVLLHYLFKKFIETCKIGESFYTIDNFASLICDKIDGGKDVVIALDAMDEIALQDNTRAFVRHVKELQNFCGNEVKIIITDRGQTAAQMFDGAYVCELQEFNDDNVNEYCDKLFDLLEKKELTNKELDINFSDLKDKVKRLSKDIKRNPFMLTQVVSLYAMTGKLNDSEIGMFDDITDVMFKSERLKFGEAMSSNIVEMLSEFAYYRQIKIGEGIIVTREIAIEFFDKLLKDRMEAMMSRLTVEELTYDIVIKYFDELLKKENGKTVERLTGEELTEYIVFREFYNFRDKKFFHESYGEYLTARYFCDKVFNKCGNVVDQKKLDELLSHCGDEFWKNTIRLFIKKSRIKKIDIPDGVQSICNSLFAGCDNIRKVLIADSVKLIGESAFTNCSCLNEIILGNGVEEIGEWAFSLCKSLTSVVIGSHVKTIGDHTFYYCTALATINIPDNVVYIGENCFCYCISLISVTLGKRVEIIGKNAFNQCKALVSVEIPDNVFIVEKAAFSQCISLQYVKIGDGVKVIEENSFCYCDNLKNVDIGSGVISIKKRAFYKCISLQAVTIPDNVTELDKSAFSFCNLKSVHIGKIVENIYGEVFENSYFEELNIGDNVDKINEEAFANQTCLKSLRIGKRVKIIGKKAFDGCTSLEEIQLPNSVVEIGENAFESCKSLESISLGEGINYVRGYAFAHCTSLKNCIQDQVSNIITIEGYAFLGCSSLQSIRIGKDIQFIGYHAFKGCSSIKIFCKNNNMKSSTLIWNPEDRPVIWGHNEIK